MADMQKILDTIRANASQEFQNRVPEVTKTSLAEYGQPITTYQALQNEFLNLLVNKIALVVIQSKIAKNPLAILKKGGVPLGSTIQEIFTNMAKDTGYDPTGSKLLTRTIPDVKSIYHTMNRQGQYPTTISRAQLQTAFTSYAELEKLLTSVVNQLYSADNKDEFIMMKNLFASAIKDNKIVKAAVPHITGDGAAKTFVKAVTNASGAFEFPSIAFNTYFQNRPAEDKGGPVETWTPLENQILIVRSDVLTEVNIEVLAAAFNIDKTALLAKTLKIDSFGSATNCLAVLADEAWVQVYENLYETSEFYNGQGLYWNYWLNHWQTYSFSLFANAVAFVCDDETITVDKTTLEFTTTATQTITATTTPVDAEVTWISSDPTIATVAAGVVTPKKTGACVISAVNGDTVANTAVTVTLA